MNNPVRQILKEHDVDALLISSPKHIAYLSTCFGFSENERDAYFLVTKTSQYLFTNPLYQNAIKSTSEFDLIVSDGKNPFPKKLKKIFDRESIHTVGFEDTNLTVSEFQKIQFPRITYYPVSLSELRIHKSSDEIQHLKKACELTDKAFEYIQKKITPEISESDLATRLELFIKENGADLSFPTIVAFGKNAATPHHHTGSTKLQKNDLILIDFGVRLNNYCSDMTRTFFKGTPSDDQKKAYGVVLQSQEKAIEFITKKLQAKEKVIAKEVDAVSREHITSLGFPDIPHSLGHGIGLEVHEPPRLSPYSSDELTNGMVFSLEPGIYLTNKFGIRIEDLFAIEDNTLIKLTTSSSQLIIL